MHEERLAELGITLPGPFPPHDPLDAVVVHRDIARTSGCLPRDQEGKFATGIVGRDLTPLEAGRCASLCAQNAVSLLREALGSLDRIDRVLTLTVFVACSDDFVEQPAVADGASRVMTDIFGEEAGRHTRSAIGVAALPRGAPVEVEVTVALKGPR